MSESSPVPSGWVINTGIVAAPNPARMTLAAGDVSVVRVVTHVSIKYMQWGGGIAGPNFTIVDNKSGVTLFSYSLIAGSSSASDISSDSMDFDFQLAGSPGGSLTFAFDVNSAGAGAGQQITAQGYDY